VAEKTPRIALEIENFLHPYRKLFLRAA